MFLPSYHFCVPRSTIPLQTIYLDSSIRFIFFSLWNNNRIFLPSRSMWCVFSLLFALFSFPTFYCSSSFKVIFFSLLCLMSFKILKHKNETKHKTRGNNFELLFLNMCFVYACIRILTNAYKSYIRAKVKESWCENLFERNNYIVWTSKGFSNTKSVKRMVGKSDSFRYLLKQQEDNRFGAVG